MSDWLAFDLILAGGLLWIGWAALAARDAFQMVVLFIVLGLLVALTWARLGAPDVALAEAAVGAGVTGALMLRCLARAKPIEARGPTGRRKTLAAAMAVSVTVALGAILTIAPPRGTGYASVVAESLHRSGVENPVTAVLLNFRAWDTLLEVAVLLGAVTVVWALSPRPLTSWQPGPLFLPFARLVLPLSLIVGAYLLWIGATAPGGAFQAGAVLAAALIVAALGRVWRPGGGGDRVMRGGFVLGPVAFALAAVATLPLTGGLLAYPEDWAKIWIVSIESALTLTIALMLAALFLGALKSEIRK